MYKILYIVTKEITLLDIPRVLDEQGHEVYQADFGIEGEKYNQEAVSQIVDAIQEYKVQYVISYDFIQTISQACMEADMPYISWVYDAPQKELYTHFVNGRVFFKYGKKQRMLESTYIITDSIKNLKETILGKEIIKLQELYNKI